MKKFFLQVTLLLVLSILLCSCTKEPPLVIEEATEIDIHDYTVQERREAFMKAVWGEIPQIGHMTKTPYENISFTKTVALSFDDLFYYTLVIFEQHPYLINPKEDTEVSISPDATFNLYNLSGIFSDLKRSVSDDGITTVSGFHNDMYFESTFEEVDYD